MAQRTIHLLLGVYTADRMTLSDRNRFLLGNVLPDAYESRDFREQTHFQRNEENSERIIFDFRKFREDFQKEIQEDDLYLGYYLHLFEDVLYRKYLLEHYDFWGKVNSLEKVQLLHRDYHLLNTHIVRTYGLQNTLTLPKDLDKERLFSIAPFAVSRFLEEMEGDFRETVTGETVYLTEAMTDGFYEDTREKILEEALRIRKGDWTTEPSDYAWVPGTRQKGIS